MLSGVREIVSYRSMLWSLILSELRTRYKGSVLGFLWTFMNPLLMLLVYMVVFSTVMRIRIHDYAVFLFIGLLAWNLFATAAQSSASVIIRQASMVKKIYFPRAILPLSVVGGSVFNYLFSLVILIPLLLIYGYMPTVHWAYLPLIILMEAILTSGFALIFACLNVYFRDLEHMLSIFIMVWFYLSPVVYSLNMIPKSYQQLFKLNPVGDAIMSFQNVLYYNEPVHWKLFIYAWAFSILIFIGGWQLFAVLSRRFAEEV